jgi:hypothetical protein
MTAPHDRPDPQDGDDALGRRIQELAATVEAPASLRTRLAEQERAVGDRGRRRRFALPAAAGLAALAAALVLVLALGGGGGGGTPAAPSFDAAAALALARPTAPAPAVDRSDTTLVRAQIGGVRFPNYAYAWPRWKAAGTRADRIAGRAATTVVYRGPSGDVGYTIVDGAPLAEPAGARHVRARGVRFAVIARGEVTVVTWRRGGHTCILAGRGSGAEEQLLKFAAWA